MSNAFLLDGKYINGVYPGRAVVGYPFSENGDTQSITIARQFRALEANYVRGQMGVAHDPVFADAYLCVETDPQPTGIGSIVGCQRTFARVPTTQTTYSSIAINKPAVSNYGVAINLGLVTGAGARTNLGVNYTYLTHFWDIVNNKIYGPLVAVTGADSGADYRVTWTGHGLAGTEDIALNSNYGAGSLAGFLIFPTGKYSVVDANTIDLTGWAASMDSVTQAGEFLKGYTSGADRVGSKVVSTFFLPGITPGIATPADITLPSPLINDSEFLAAVVATLTGYVAYDAGSLERWLGGPIYRLDTIQINMGNV